jgi:SSS family transporter
MNQGLSVFDYAVMIIYLAAMIGTGYWVGRKQHNTEDFFLAGRGMAWWPVAISLFASLFSAISYIAMPGEAYNYGMNMYLGGIIALLPMPIMIAVFLRLFYKLKLWTAYEYLEKRFDVRARALGSVAFMFMRGVYLGVVLYATAMLLQPTIGWPLWFSVLVVGIIGTLYTALGGMAAVIWTDVIQFFILLGGIIIIIAIVAFQVPGGLLGIWTEANNMGHGFNLSAASGFWDFDFTRRITIWAWLLAFLPSCISPAIDQVNLQRCLSCKSFKSASFAVVGATVGMLPVILIFYIAGLALLVYFKTIYKGALPENFNGDSAFTFFAANVLPIGLRGLLIAGILAAVMSTVDSTVNSLTAVTIKDIYQRLLKKNQPEEHYLKASKILTWIWGGISILFGLMIIAIFASRDIPLLEVSNVCIGTLGGIILGFFALGLLTYRSNSPGAMTGVISGVIISFSFAWFFYLSQDKSERVSFLWLGLVSNSSVIIIGYISSLFYGLRHKDIDGYVVWKQFKWFKGKDIQETELCNETAIEAE